MDHYEMIGPLFKRRNSKNDLEILCGDSSSDMVLDEAAIEPASDLETFKQAKIVPYTRIDKVAGTILIIIIFCRVESIGIFYMSA